ncbi:hypothetical protein GE09DRAFT_767359 [Coniochaeta sp. 2T2.1]|nr:hypothetical protein GE09DRAFT_767359 [Coniochaeta sp. 2T2.1]
MAATNDHIPIQNGDHSENDVDLQTKISDFEAQLSQLRSQQHQKPQSASQFHDNSVSHLDSPTHSHNATHPSPTFPPSTHLLLLLSDSALPLGSFAFSSGLESFLAHTTRTPQPPPQLFTTTFLPLSISSYASTTLPFVLAAHASPHLLPDLDDALDAATICTVARRASVAQGRALLGIWERSFAPGRHDIAGAGDEKAGEELLQFSRLLRSSSSSRASSTDGGDGGGGELPPAVAAHIPPLFGAVCRAAGLDRQATATVYMLNHVKALVSAAVRRGMFGPYQAQKILASTQVRQTVEAVVAREWNTHWWEAGQGVPVMDLWVGRHEMLYSRIFNS